MKKLTVKVNRKINLGLMIKVKLKKAIEIAYFIILFAIIQPSIALEMTELQATSEMWLNEDNIIDISFRCDMTANVSAKIEGNGRLQSIQAFSEQQFADYSVYSKSVQLDSTITANDNPYLLTVFCEKNGTQVSSSTSINVNMLEIAGIELAIPQSNPTGIVHPTDTIVIRADVIKNSNRLFSGITFNVLIDGTAAEITGVTSTGKWEISAKIPDVVGEKILTVEATYNGHKASGTSSINIRPLLSVAIESPSVLYPYKLTDTSDIALPVVVNYKSKPLTENDAVAFEAQLDGQVLTIKDIKYSNKWELVVNVPRMAPKESAYNLKILATYSSIKASSRELQIQFLLPFKGTLQDANGNSVQADIRIKKAGFEEKITTTNGQYSAMLQPGKYDIELYFPTYRARLTNAELQSSDNLYAGENAIKYDYFEEHSKKTIALDFLLPFASARIEMLYNDSKNIEILKCGNWNFAARACNSQWEKINASIDTEINLIIIDTNTLSAFSISEPAELILNANIDKSSYQAGENILLSGSVTENGNAVSAKIKYSLEGKEYSIDAQGSFEATIKVPESEGEFSLNVKAEKDARTATKEFSFSVYQKRSIRISAPSAIEISPNQNKSLVITISNEGQADINNIEVSIDLPDGWYDFDSSAFNLAAGDKKNVAITLLVPEGAENRAVAISAKGGEASARSEFMLNIAKQAIATGQVAADATPIYIVIFSIISISILFTFIFIKKKSSKKQKIAIEMLHAAKSQIARKKKSAKDVVKNPFGE